MELLKFGDEWVPHPFCSNFSPSPLTQCKTLMDWISVQISVSVRVNKASFTLTDTDIDATLMVTVGYNGYLWSRFRWHGNDHLPTEALCDYIIKPCLHVTSACASVSKFNIESMVNQTHTQRMGPRPFLWNANVMCKHLHLVSWIPFFASHVDAHADVRCKQSIRVWDGIGPCEWALSSRDWVLENDTYYTGGLLPGCCPRYKRSSASCSASYCPQGRTTLYRWSDWTPELIYRNNSTTITSTCLEEFRCFS